MKKGEHAIQIADLLAIAHFNEELVIFINSEEGYSPTSLGIMANFDTKQFGEIKPLNQFRELNSFDSIIDIDAQISYRQRISDEIDSETIKLMLNKFSQEYLVKNGNLGVSKEYNPSWELNE